ncbi:MAG TPA: TIGR03086 family metal-binding protein [Mycobacteriales bacterium]|nr:TIGR03086 family metal-binding protein [Mycobacteriales bacterium]
MTDDAQLLAMHHTARDAFGRLVHGVAADGWSAPTPCSDWDVRTLVGHVVDEQRWVPPLLGEQRTVTDVGDELSGDALGDDPAAAWDREAGAAYAVWDAPGALGREVSLSRGPTAARDYATEMLTDLIVHGWDLAQGSGQQYAMDEATAQLLYDYWKPHAAMLAESGMFAPAVAVPDDAPASAKLLALSGRKP